MPTVSENSSSLYGQMPRRISVAEALDASVQEHGDVEAWIFDDHRVTFNEMHKKAEAVAAGLAALGVAQGDRVATWMGNRPEWLALLFACGRLGAILVPLNTRSSVNEAHYCLEHSQASVLVYTPQIATVDLDRAIAALTSEAGDKPQVNVTHFVRIGEVHESATTTWDAAFCREPASAQRLEPARISPELPLLLQYTSGTTARPKGALIDHINVLNRGVEGVRRLGVGRGDRMFNTQPFYHVGGSCVAATVPLSVGCCVVTSEFYDPAATFRLIERERCVARTGFAAMYVSEMGHPAFENHDLSSLKYAWCIGPKPILERVQARFGFNAVVQLFAATETNGTCGAIDDSEEKRLNSCGRPVAGTELRIVDPDTRQALPTGEVGEISIRGWGRMLGYYNDEVRTAEVVDNDGWFYTGDLGCVDEEGYLYYQGRLKDMLKPGGENVAAEEVESVLCTHPEIKQAAVIGAPDERLGEVVMAVIERMPGSQVSEQDVVAFCRTVMAGFRVPRYIRFVTEWPMTASGKIKKTDLREQFSDVGKV